MAGLMRSGPLRFDEEIGLLMFVRIVIKLLGNS